jgi:chemotaxis protein methyltransferase CheR/type IV pilus assembly protein PilK
MFLAQSADWGVMADRWPDLDDVRVQLWTDLVERRTGIVIPAERGAFLGAGLRVRMRETGAADYDVYYRRMSAERAWSEEWTQLVDRLTVHETSFFRHEPSLQLLSEHVLPALLAERNGLQVWSVGCATGEEPYTLAMLIQEQIEIDGRECLFGITATDISQPALQAARAGVYGGRRIETLSVDMRMRFCEELGDGKLRIAESLRRRICFAQLNVLQAGGFPLRNLDLIYCQNMLIYFPRVQRLQIVETLAQRLAPGGVLILGPGDLPCWSHSEFERIRFEGTLAFRRLGADMANA